MGYFNTCLLKDDASCRKLLDVAESCNLHILPLAATHHSPGCIPSLLDLILVSSLDLISKHGQCSADAFSYHDLIYLSYKIRPPTAKFRTLLRHYFGGMDRSRLCDAFTCHALHLDWSVAFDAGTIDKKVEMFNTLLTRLYDIHAPIRPIKIKHLPAPWLSEDLKVLIKKKNQAKSCFTKNNSDHNREIYKRARNRCNTSCRDAQRRHIHKSVENGDIAKTWNFF
ncbi:unnamed protein product [Euphydryas editha]|uniref:Uncharacterized protein n=1 Tax=Euphydryas editha TaxID=104508 RepID=A0AAU9U2K7_EUPED|nr:unnamed protein product [Euphydryas editha]